MKLPRRRFLHLVTSAAVLPALSRSVWAQTYPSRPVTVIVPFAAGGLNDAVMRIVSESLRVSLAQPVIIENVSGAEGSIGTGRLTRAAPDGYTVSLGGWSTHVGNAAIYPLQYDVLKDFEPISEICISPVVVRARPTLPAQDLMGLITWLKANPDKASQGTTGSLSRVAGVLFQKVTGTQFQFVPYRGGGQEMQDLTAGYIDLVIDVTGGTGLQEQVAGNLYKVYAVTSKSRLAAAPEIPTVDEAGMPGFNISSWYGLFAPKGTPRAVIGKLNAAVGDALADAGVRQRLVDLGQEIPPRDQQTPEALGALQKAEIEKWWPIIKAANIKAE
jgi:tripartite-type tricarboxylate transporter receptor subunit TctC